MTAAAIALAASAQAAVPVKLTVISQGATGSVVGGSVTGADGIAARELRGPKRRGTSPLRSDPLSDGPVVAAKGTAPSVNGAATGKSTPELLAGWEGLNHRDSRLADRGNQFSGEPADQGVCAGNGYVLESVNSAIRVYTTDGAPASPVLSLNQFYGFPSAFVRPAGPFGPFTFDISCHYDPDSDRWFHLAVDLDQDPATGDFTGRNYLDLAVSTSGDPLGSWNVYRIPGINDGTEGTPDHDCAGGPCFADFPHFGVDRNGVYITTNEFPLFADGFTGAQVYAISKQALASGSFSLDVFLWNTADDPVAPDQPGFTVWPALSPGKQFAGNDGGTEYFVSSNAVFDDLNADSSELVLWRLTNTRSLDSASSAPLLSKRILPSQRYTVPPASPQRDVPNTHPLLDCLSNDDLFGPGVGCWALLLGANPPPQVLGPIDTSDSRILDVRYANGKLWAVLGTGATVASVERAGVGWFVIKPNAGGGSIDKQGILAVEGESLAYPTLGVTESGRGVMGFTRVGETLFPSQGYAALDAKVGAGEVKMAAEGNAAQDGFTEYTAFSNRPRWGDYGAAAVDGQNVYLAGQYIAQGECSLIEFATTAFSCSGTRTIFANWSTRVSKLKP